MLCEGTDWLNAAPLTGASASRCIEFVERSCHTWAEAALLKLARLTVTGVLPERALLMTMIVSAPSDVRRAANEDRTSGFGPLALTLRSPKVARAPS